MKQPLKIFIDSDVIISSLISESGAAYLLFNQKNLQFSISNYSYKELVFVVKRLNLSSLKLSHLLNKFRTINITVSLGKIKKDYQDYVLDINDAHIIAGAVKGKTNFLVSYNLKHYQIDKIKADFGIITLTPALFLQYLRSKRLGLS